MKKFFIILILFLLAGATGAAWLLRSSSGHARLEHWLQKRSPSRIRIEGLSGRLPFAGRLQSLEVSDSSGVWLTAHSVAWSLQPDSLWRRRPFVVRELAAEEIQVTRWPDYETGNQTARLPEIWLQSVQTDRLQLPYEIIGEPLALFLRGAFKTESNGWSAAVSALTSWRGEKVLAVGSARKNSTESVFEIRRIEGEGFELRGSGSWKPARHFQFSGSFTNAALLARLAGIDESGHGSVEGAVQWDDKPVGVFTARVSDVAGYGISLSNAFCAGAWNGADGQARIAAADGAWRGVTWRVAQPVEIARSTNGVQWVAPRIEWTGSALNSSGRIARADVDASFTVPPTDLAQSPLSNRFSAGRARAALHIAGPRSNPVWRFELDGDDLRPRLSGAFQLKPAQLRLRGDAASGVVRASATWSGWTKEAVAAEAALPIRLALDGGPFGPDTNGAISARLRFAANLAEAGAFTDLRGAQIAGDGSGDIQVAGTWARPTVRGRIALQQGRAEFPDSGTVLQNIQLVLEGNQDQLVIREASADDGEDGRLTLDGAIQFDPAHGFPLHAKLALYRAALWRRAGNHIRFDGRVAVSGPLAALSVTGRVDLAEAEIQLPPSRPTVPQLPLAQKNETHVTATATSSWLNAVSLDVTVRGRDIRVAGRGLDSTWRANLQVTGRASAPRVRGPLTVERGYFLFMGRRFALDRAMLSFDGQWPPAPQLDLAASSRAGEMNAWLYAAGPLDAPVLNLESDPSYPTDEILSRLLFGRSTDAINPFQAVRLAHGLSLLRGRGRTLDVLERGQSILRVDQLELVQSEENASISAISVGKYVGRNVYVEGEKGLGGAADLITVEVELTPSLILSTESSPRIREGIGLKWRRDY